jgi:hypothetical protein
MWKEKLKEILMVAIIIDGYVHRLLHDGSVESLPAPELGEEWQRPDPREMNLLDGEVWQIQQTLLNLNSLFPKDRPGIPAKSKEVKEILEPAEPV